VLVDGEPQTIGGPSAARKLGIVAMYQDPTVFEDLTVAENVFAGRSPRTRLRAVDWKAMHREARRLLAEIGADLAPDAPVRGLGVADRQLIEIAKALSSSARLLIMDEPTAALSPHEVESLFATVRRMRDRGVAIIFVSHRLEEVMAIADTVTVLRDGRHIATKPAGELAQGEIVRLMVGRSLDDLFPKEEAEIGDVVLRAEGLTRRGVFSNVSFELRRGEIVGLAGFVGSGRTEVARSIFGIDRLDSGQLWIDGRGFHPRSPRSALRRGLAYLPEDRLQQGLVQPMSISINASMAVLPRLTPAGILQPWRGDIAGADRAQPLRREPAKGRPLEVARSRAPHPDSRRADARRRRRHQGGRAPRRLAPGGPGLDHPDDLVRAAGNPRHERPRVGHARRPARR
jgi:rhamnose transport system ATP-binding protein